MTLTRLRIISVHVMIFSLMSSLVQTSSCFNVSVEYDATFCIEGPICTGGNIHGSCPLKNQISSFDCDDTMASYDPLTKLCTLKEHSSCHYICYKFNNGTVDPYFTKRFGNTNLHVLKQKKNLCIPACVLPNYFENLSPKIEIQQQPTTTLPTTTPIPTTPPTRGPTPTPPMLNCSAGLALYSSCTNSSQCGDRNGHRLECSSITMRCECPSKNILCLNNKPSNNKAVAESQFCRSSSQCAGHGNQCNFDSDTNQTQCQTCSSKLYCFATQKDHWSQCMTREQCLQINAEFSLSDSRKFNCDNPLLSSRKLKKHNYCEASNSKSPLFGNCLESKDCGDYNGNALVCEKQLGTNSIGYCSCPKSDISCQKGNSPLHLPNIAGQDQICNRNISCYGHGSMCNPLVSPTCRNCQLKLSCFSRNMNGGNTEEGVCLTLEQCHKQQSIDERLNCLEIIGQSTPKPQPNNIKSDDEETEPPQKNSTDSQLPSGMAFIHESLPVQIIASVIFIVLVVTCISACVFQIRIQKKREIFKEIEQDWEDMEFPVLVSPPCLSPTISPLSTPPPISSHQLRYI